jgi:hypothetical protein
MLLGSVIDTAGVVVQGVMDVSWSEVIPALT